MACFKSPDQSVGFTQFSRDPDDLEKLLSEILTPVFGACAHDLESTGKGKVALLYKNVQKYDPSFGYHEQQTPPNEIASSLKIDSEYNI